MQTDISTFKKLVFSGLIFSVFLILLEGVLSLIPTMLGFDQRGSYEKILSGGSTIITLGDSVTYGYGLPKDASWPSQLQRKIQTRTQGSMLVINRAVSGMNSAEALQRERHTIEKIAQSKSRPIVLLMIGHNDLTGSGWRQWSVKNEKTESNRVRPPPRLWRILRWASDVSKKEEKINWKDPTVQKTLEKNVSKLDEWVREMGGQLYLMTYLLPGTGETVSPQYAKDVELSRSIQGAGNQIIRERATEESIPLIDVERSIVAPSQWSSTWFQDHIHPTEMANEKIAEVTIRHLVTYGELPITAIEE